MQIDPDDLRDHYQSLTDDELVTMDRSELTPMAQKIYDEVLAERGLLPAEPVVRSNKPPQLSIVPRPEYVDLPDGILDQEEEPEWLADAVEVHSAVVQPGGREQESLADARRILDAAGIPSYAELVEIPSEEMTFAGTHRWRLLVPGQHDFRAMSTLEQERSNPEFEAVWRARLEACSDKELSAMNPRTVFSSLFDRIERITRAYEEEVARRRFTAQ